LLKLFVQTQQLLRVEDIVAAVAEQVFEVLLVLFDGVVVELQEVGVSRLADLARVLVFAPFGNFLRGAALGEDVILQVFLEFAQRLHLLSALGAVEAAVHYFYVLLQFDAVGEDALAVLALVDWWSAWFGFCGFCRFL
jgi:hypothetical protein